MNIDEVTVHAAGLVPRWVTARGWSGYLTSHQGQLSLAIPSWVGAMNTGNGHDYRHQPAIGTASSSCGPVQACRGYEIIHPYRYPYSQMPILYTCTAFVRICTEYPQSADGFYYYTILTSQHRYRYHI